MPFAACCNNLRSTCQAKYGTHLLKLLLSRSLRALLCIGRWVSVKVKQGACIKTVNHAVGIAIPGE
jgi:hypothetical protein